LAGTGLAGTGLTGTGGLVSGLPSAPPAGIVAPGASTIGTGLATTPIGTTLGPPTVPTTSLTNLFPSTSTLTGNPITGASSVTTPVL
jgi:hypothetical protein